MEEKKLREKMKEDDMSSNSDDMEFDEINEINKLKFPIESLKPLDKVWDNYK